MMTFNFFIYWIIFTHFLDLDNMRMFALFMSFVSWLICWICLPVIRKINSTLFDSSLLRKVSSSGCKFTADLIRTKLPFFLNSIFKMIFSLSLKLIKPYSLFRWSWRWLVFFNIICSLKKSYFLFDSWIFSLRRSRCPGGIPLW